MAEIKIEIKDCIQCPYHQSVRVYTADSWEEAYDWLCNKSGGKEVAGFVKWTDRVPIPDWCPILVKE